MKKQETPVLFEDDWYDGLEDASRTHEVATVILDDDEAGVDELFEIGNSAG